MATRITATAFKARCLALFDEVVESGSEFVITKRGRPVARVEPVDGENSVAGSVTFLVSDEELVHPLPVEWSANSSPAARRSPTR